MSEEAPKPRRNRLSCAFGDAILVQFTDKGDAPLDEARERKGRPERSPSLPPADEPPEADKPAA